MNRRTFFLSSTGAALIVRLANNISIREARKVGWQVDSLSVV